MAGARQNVVTPPVPRQGGHTNGAAMGTSDGRARRVVEHSVYNWVELVYQAFGQTIPSDPHKVALLGVREETFSDGAGASAEQMTAKEAAAGDTTGGAVQGLHADARVADRFDRDKKGNALRTKTASRVTFNDMLYMVWTEQGAQHDQHVQAFRCTIDPGFNEEDTTGTPLLCEGLLYKARPTVHKGDPGALQIYRGSASAIRTARDATKSRNVFTNLQDALIEPHAQNGNQRWLFCADEPDNPSIHIHWSLDYGDDGPVRNWSTGCTVLAHARVSDRYQTDFRGHWKSAPNSSEIPYLVVSSKYLVLYDAWQAELRRDPSGPATPASVIRKEGIPLMPGAQGTAGLRLPSIATAPFVTSVQEAVQQLTAGTYPSVPRGSSPAALAANLERSLTNLGIATLAV